MHRGLLAKHLPTSMLIICHVQIRELYRNMLPAKFRWYWETMLMIDTPLIIPEGHLNLQASQETVLARGKFACISS